jgi:hypothetical protein
LSRYWKAIIAVVVTVLTALVPYLSNSNHLTSAEWVNVVIVGLGAITVYLAPNLPGSWSIYTKAIVAALTTAATLLVSAIGAGSFGSVPSAEWIQIILAALGTLGVYGVPNAAPAAVARSAPSI